MNAGRSSFPTCGMTAALIGGILAVDWWLPLGFAVPVLYVVPVLVSSWIPRSRAIPFTAATVSLLTALDFLQTPLLTSTSVMVFNRFFSLLVIWVTAILCMRRQQDERNLRAANEGIERQVEARTAELAKANKELGALRAEVVSQLAAIVKSSDDAIIGMSLNGIIQSWNAGAERVYGYAAQEVIGRSISLLCPPDRLEEVPLMLDRIARGDHVRNVETIQRKKRGQRIDVSLTMSPLKDAEDDVVGASWIARDVTRRKRMEAALRESEARFHMMADTAPVMVWMSQPETGCTFFNKRWLEFTGRMQEQERGDGWLEGVHPQDRSRCTETYRAALLSRQPFTMEYRLKRNDGTYRWVLDTGVPRFEPDCAPCSESFSSDRKTWLPSTGDKPGGILCGYIGSCIDLTERKEMEDELRKTLKEKESLLREVHHRVKNNLQVISSLLNLQSASIKDPQVAQLFRECQTRITSIALLHETLHRSSDLSCIKMGDYIRTLTGHLFRSYGVDPKAIALDLHVEDIEFDIDTGMTCGLIVEELVSNCLKHAFVEGKGGCVLIGLQAQGDGSYVLEVSDDGVGIPKDGVLNNPDSLGLDLVTLLAEKLEGAVELQSGQGTSWRIQFHQLHYQERM